MLTRRGYSGRSPQTEEVDVKRMLPVAELARDERFVHINIEDVDLRPSQRHGDGVAAAEPVHRAVLRGARRGPPADARHLRRRDPGARGRRSHLLGLRRRRVERGADARRGALRAEARHGPPVLGRGSPRRDLGQAHRAHGHRGRRVRRADDALRGGLQRGPGAAPHRRQPRARGPRDRRVQHDARVRRRRRATRSCTSARTGCSPTRSPT